MWPTMRFSAGVLPRSDASLAKATAISGFCRGVASSSAISSVLWKNSSHVISGTSAAFSYIFTVTISPAKIQYYFELSKFSSSERKEKLVLALLSREEIRPTGQKNKNKS
jgi:hypothetical protein